MKQIDNKFYSYIIPENYSTNLTKIELEEAIYYSLHVFEKYLKKNLNLYKIRSPIFLPSNTLINDGLNGEKPVYFKTKTEEKFELVHSLAKWKRIQLNKLNLNYYEGIVTNMKAIRREEFFDNIHSIFVDQWDWELKIKEIDRNLETLKYIVKQIYEALKKTCIKIENKFNIKHELPNNIKFITTQELEYLYSNLTPKEREHEIARKYKAVCLIGIGYPLKLSSKPHDNRASDYDDWSTKINHHGIETYGLNCDILLYNEILDQSLEISSMGIRVNSEALKKQNQVLNNTEYINSVLNDTISQSIGGGIGQSRLVMWLLQKCHIGEVQVSNWPNKEWLLKNNVNIL